MVTREWLDNPDERYGYCVMVADDGARCQLDADHADEHDFAVPRGAPVDGGQKWSRWIQQVHAVRDLLLDQPPTDDRPYAWGVVMSGPEADRLVAIAQVVGLALHATDGRVELRAP
jgi:hypothetical protein